MTRGKYAKRAAGARETEALERLAGDAERQAARATAELASLRESSESIIAALRVKLTALERERDSATSPGLAAAMRTVAEVKEENASLRKACARTERSKKRYSNVLVALGVKAGFSPKEAAPAVGILLDQEDLSARVQPEPHSLRRDSGGDVIDKARGYTERGDILGSFYIALAEGTWHRDGSALVLDGWFTGTGSEGES